MEYSGNNAWKKATAFLLLCLIAAGTAWITAYNSLAKLTGTKKLPGIEETKASTEKTMKEINRIKEEMNKSNQALAAALLRDARVALMQKQFDKALSLANDVLKTDLENASAYQLRGIANYYLNNTAQAVDDLNKAARLKPDNAETFFYRALAVYKEANAVLAIEDLSRAIALQPNFGQAYYYRGLIRQRQGDGKAAQADFVQACELGVEAACKAAAQIQ
ncbi:MAG: hypothetical protein N2491_03175 [Negativicutes bacterium]|nr:hypothetical protein [Negativicutes bacterium]